MSNNDKNKVSIKAPIVPDGGWGWLIVFASFMIHFVMDGITYSMGQVFLEPMRKELSLDRASVSSIFGILPAVTLGAGPIATVLTNMYGCRTVAIAGTCIASLGIGFALMYLPAIVSVGFYFEQKRTFAMGVAVCGSGVGTFVLSYVINGIVPLPQEPSEQRRLERKTRKQFKQKQIAQCLVSQNVPTTSDNSGVDGYASFFGFFSGGSVTLTAIVLIDIVGIDKLSDAFGVVLLFVGVATAIGTPIVGGMRDAFSHFTRPFLWPYLIFGSCTVISGVILFAIPFLQRKKPSDVHIEMDVNKFYSGKDRLSQEQQQKI
ncbi:unnamed protein product [Rotaria sordida]|uniref:Uncharacterized protein n=1 Tax=Rotaria sordida TaxID=392033 RepID=A0A819SAS8_9BILA|nr:unnamed protein product [Rotaria sordida]